MRLIDADKLLKFFTVDTANQTYRFGTVKKQIESAPTVQAIPLDKVKEARRELDKLPIYGAKFTDDFRIHLDREEVFAILDKLIESEE